MNYTLPINILIADDHQLITDGIAGILNNEKIIGEIYTAKNGQEAVDKASQHNIDCVIMDINMPVLNGFDATIQIKKTKSFIKIIVVSMLSDASIVSKMLKAGADAFVNKDTGKIELLNAINKVMNNEIYISPDIAANYFAHHNDRNIYTGSNEKQLTTREIEIVKLIADGLTNHEVAEKLFLSHTTVETHRKNMLAKLKIKNTAALVKYAAEHHLL